jgi:hypothetical protein
MSQVANVSEELRKSAVASRLLHFTAKLGDDPTLWQSTEILNLHTS